MAGLLTGLTNYSAQGLLSITSDGTKVTFLPATGDYTRIGDAGTTSHSLDANDDLLVTGELEVDGAAFFDGAVTMASTLTGAGATHSVASVGTAATDAQISTLIVNPTAAAAGAQQYSPLWVLEGQGWKTDATASSLEVQWALQVRPVQGAAAPSSALHYLVNTNDTGFTSTFNLSSGGSMTGIRFYGNPGATASSPNYSWEGFSDDGMFLASDGVIGFSSGGTQRLSVRSTGLALASGLAIFSTATATTDVAPADDTTEKKITLQKLAAPPTNAAYIAFTGGPGNPLYLVCEEGT